MAAGYTIKELMEYMGHADLQMVNRYVKLLPQPGEDDAADRLNAYLRRSEESVDGRFEQLGGLVLRRVAIRVDEQVLVAVVRGLQRASRPAR